MNNKIWFWVVGLETILIIVLAFTLITSMNDSDFYYDRWGSCSVQFDAMNQDIARCKIQVHEWQTTFNDLSTVYWELSELFEQVWNECHP